MKSSLGLILLAFFLGACGPDVEALLGEAESAFEDGRPDGAVLVADELAKTGVSSSPERLRLAELYLRLRRHDDAVDLLRDASSELSREERACLAEGYRRARADGFTGTDDASLVERSGHTVRLVEGSPENLKVTTPEDLVMAEAILRERGS